MKYLPTLLFALSSQIAFAVTCDDLVQMLAWVETADAKKDALAAKKSGDNQLYAVYGFSFEFPGTAEYNLDKSYFTNGNFKKIEGTGDDLCSDEHQRLNGIAYDYAEVYNKTLLGSKQ